jgi:ribonuclease HII
MVIVGIDEVGRGCWAGPLLAGAVVLSEPIAGLRDSKKLSKAQREKLAVTIHAEALAVGIGWVTAQELDTIGLTKAVGLAMERAVAQITVGFDEIIIDGNINYFPGNNRARAVVKADDSEPAVSAASIVAKVARDQYMSDVAKQYPQYGFEKHVGYGTALHSQSLQLHGVCELHRRSFKPIKAVLESNA